MRNIRLVPPAFAAVVVAFLFVAGARVATVSVTAGDEQKMKPEELVAKHLESIGTAEARAAARNRIINGISELTLKQGGSGNLVGSALMASEGNKNMIMMGFNRADYDSEKISYNGNKLTVAQIRPGVRSPTGEFFRTHDEMFREGLFGGTLSQSWPLLNVAERKPKLEYGGTKKIGGRLAHELKYMPNKGASLKIKLYFDAENFRHIRSEYERQIAATMGARPIDSGGRLDTRYKAVEEFSDFKEENGLTLPHTYKFELH
ncbi:MAG: hypothetical protein WAM70_07545, partial [Pyrinomonadaceae bacterium]